MAERTSAGPTISIRLAHGAADHQAILELRRQVFVIEQGVTTAVDGDPQDRNSFHVVGLVDGAIVGAGRLYAGSTEGQIAWMAVLPAYRRHGVGRAIMWELVRLADLSGIELVVLNAQTHALRFYQHFGFRTVGDIFLMGGIEHQLMVRRFP